MLEATEHERDIVRYASEYLRAAEEGLNLDCTGWAVLDMLKVSDSRWLALARATLERACEMRGRRSVRDQSGRKKAA
jgi:hypothetical protein